MTPLLVYRDLRGTVTWLAAASMAARHNRARMPQDTLNDVSRLSRAALEDALGEMVVRLFLDQTRQLGPSCVLHLCAIVMSMPTQLTIRGVPDEVGRRLKRVSQAKGQSVNATVLEILATAVGARERRHRLARYMTWNQEDLAELNQALAAQRSTDDPLWR